MSAFSQELLGTERTGDYEAQWHAGPFLDAMRPVGPVVPVVDGVADAGTLSVPDVPAGETAFVKLFYSEVIPSSGFKDNSFPFLDCVARIVLADSTGEATAPAPDCGWAPPRIVIGSSDFSSAAFSPDGQIILSGNESSARLWTVEGELIRAIEEPEGVSAAAFSPDGSQYATAGSTIRLRNAADDQIVGEFTPSDQPVESLVFSPDGSLILANRRSSGWIWETETGRLLHSFDGEGAPVAFTPDGSRFVVADNVDFQIAATLWNTESGTQIREFKFGFEYNSQFGPISLLTTGFSLDKRFLYGYSALHGCKIHKWDLESGEPQYPFRSICRVSEPRVEAFSPDSSMIAIFGYDFNGPVADFGLHLHSTDTAELLIALPPSFLVGFSPDGTKLLADNVLYDISALTRPRMAIRRMEDGAADLFRSSGKLESSARPNGPWSPVEEAGNPHRIEANESMNLFRARRD